MARINIEDSLFKDRRFIDLCIKMGSRTMALGALLESYMLSQSYAKPDNPRCLIPASAWKSQGLHDDLIACGLAVREDDKIYVRGSAECHAWLIQKQAAGRQGGLKKSASKTKHLKQNARSTTEAQPKRGQAKPKPPTLTLPLTPSLPLTLANENPSDSKPQAFIAAYCQRFKQRWGTSPVIMGVEAGAAKRIAKTMSLEKFEKYLEAFFTMPDAWLVKNKHRLATFESKLNEIVVFEQSGSFITNKQAHQADEMASNALLLKQVREGKI